MCASCSHSFALVSNYPTEEAAALFVSSGGQGAQGRLQLGTGILIVLLFAPWRKGELQQQERLIPELQANNSEAYVKPFNQHSLTGA